MWVGQYEFPVKIIDAKHKALDEGASHGCTFYEGDYDFGIPRGILLADNLDARLRLEIFLHELTHVINFVHRRVRRHGLDGQDR